MEKITEVPDFNQESIQRETIRLLALYRAQAVVLVVVDQHATPTESTKEDELDVQMGLMLSPTLEASVPDILRSLANEIETKLQEHTGPVGFH